MEKTEIMSPTHWALQSRPDASTKFGQCPDQFQFILNFGNININIIIQA